MRGYGHGKLTGISPQMLELRRELERVARSDAKVLITGESGVGKELIAREVHALSARAHRAFIPVNCAGLPETLLESELFGHVKGSFTGAYRDKAGKLESAHEGTIFLDEVGEMTLRMQGLLLRFLETGELQKVGAERPTNAIKVRVIAATNCDLPHKITQGLFREDLFYRLNVIQLKVPPLRARKQDIPLMIEQFLQQFRIPAGPVRSMTPEAVAALVEYSWPGNVRELENVIERLVVVCHRDVIELSDLPLELRAHRSQSAPSADGGRHHPVVDELYARVTSGGECFWSTVYPLYMQRDITRTDVRDLVRKGLEEARGSYKIVVRLFNMESSDYKKFLNFLRKHDCQLPFQAYRQIDRHSIMAVSRDRMGAMGGGAPMGHA
jgi:transcriptional regulator with PAS, ATPase and Fis domain